MSIFQRLQPPVSPINAGMDVPVEQVSLKNGVSMFLINAGTEDVMRMEFIFRAGMVREHLPLLANTTNMMLTEGSEYHSSEELNTILDYYGIFLNLSAEKDTAGLTVYFLNKHIEKALELIREILFQPVFPEKELNLLMKKRLNWYQGQQGKSSEYCHDQFFESVFGSDHPYGRQISENDYENMNPALLKDFHLKFYLPEKMTVIVSGRIHEKTTELFGKYFGELNSGKIYTEDSAQCPQRII